MDATTTDAIITSVMDDIGATLTSGLPIVFALIGALIGLFFVVRLVRKYVGSSKG
jgi:uncharacterized protein YneF (UPF0154 family)